MLFGLQRQCLYNDVTDSEQYVEVGEVKRSGLNSTINLGKKLCSDGVPGFRAGKLQDTANRDMFGWFFGNFRAGNNG